MLVSGTIQGPRGTDRRVWSLGRDRKPRCGEAHSLRPVRLLSLSIRYRKNLQETSRNARRHGDWEAG